MFIVSYIALIIAFICWMYFGYLFLKKDHSPYPMWIACAFVWIANVMIHIYK